MWFEITWTGMLLGLLLVSVLFYSFLKPFPQGTSLRTKKHLLPESKVKFLYDLTCFQNGKRQSEMHIYDEVKGMLEKAEHYFVMDMFLFNLNQADLRKHRPVTRELCDLLIAKKKKYPGFKIYVITDPFNSFYGSYEPEIYAGLKNAGVKVIETDITKLRDRNYLYSAVWRLFFSNLNFFLREPNWIRDPTSRKKRMVSMRSILQAVNARANHRKVVITDHGEDLCALISSSNLHEASSWFTNVGFKVYGVAAFECLQSEEAVALFSGEEMDIYPSFSRHDKGNIRVQVLTEDKIEKPLVEDIRAAKPGETISILMLFIADLDILRALRDASLAGVHVRLALDTNTVSFEQKKLGFPNHVTGWLLHDHTGGKAEVRWWSNRTDQLHAKMMVIEKKEELVVYNGSANYTVRNVGGYTLENSLRLEIPKETKLSRDILLFVERAFEKPYSDPIETYKKGPFYLLKLGMFAIQKITGFTTF